MNIVTDVEAQQANKKEAEKNLEDMKENLSTVKRNINILIGRNAGQPAGNCANESAGCH